MTSEGIRLGMTRILILIKGLGRGGAEQLLVNAAPHFDAAKFSFDVAYLLPWKNALVPELEAAGVHVQCLHGARDPRWIGRLRTLVREREINIIHAHSPFAAIGARTAFWKSTRVRIVYTEHNMWARYKAITAWGNALTFTRNDFVFAVSDEVRQSISYPAPLSRRSYPQVETLYHGPDPEVINRSAMADGVREELGIPVDAPIIGTVANLKAHKGHQYLLDAAALVRETVPNARFVWVGVGPMEDDLRRKAGRMGLNGTIIFTGFRPDAPRLMRAFDLFALPSLHEGLPIALVEAMTLGKPVVVTDAGGIPEVVQDGKQGYMVPSGDPVALADRIVAVLGDAPLRRRMGEEARLRASEFDIRGSVARMERLYEEISKETG
jgi:glycosyltransferase involved in cell wall biosynthesis